jgi:hypothetical protein
MNHVSVERTSGEAGPMFSRSEFIELYDPIVKGLTTYSGAMCDGYTAMWAPKRSTSPEPMNPTQTIM